MPRVKITIPETLYPVTIEAKEGEDVDVEVGDAGELYINDSQQIFAPGAWLRVIRED